MSFFTSKRVYFTLATAVFIYIVLRAIYIPLYYDEIQTLVLYVKTGYLSPFNELKTANNHLLNTFFTSVFYNLFGSHPFSLRLPNVLSFILFVVYLYKIGLFFKTKTVRWGFYLGITFSLNIVSFFALSRGYGMSLAFLVASIYYTSKTFYEYKKTNFLLSVLFMLMALYANFSLLLFVLISLSFLILNLLVNIKKYLNIKSILLLGSAFIIAALAITFAVNVLFFYKAEGELWWGSSGGFWNVTVKSLVYLLFKTKDLSYVFQVFIVFMTLVMTALFLLKDQFLKKYNFRNLFYFLLVLNVLGIYLLNAFFDVNFPYQRTGVHLFLLFFAAYCFAVDKVLSKTLRVVLMLFVFYLPLHFILNANLTYVTFWEEDTVPYEYFNKVKEMESSNTSKYNPSIFVGGMGFGSWQYQLNYTNERMPVPIYVNNVNPGVNYDYLLVNEKTIAPVMDYYDTLVSEKSIDYCLYKRKNSVNRSLIRKKEFGAKITNDEFVEFISFRVDSLTSKSLFFNLNLSIEYHDIPFQSSIIYSVYSKTSGKSFGYKDLHLTLNEKSAKGAPIIQGEFLNDLPQDELLEIKVFLYNTKKVKYKINRTKVEVYSVI